MYKIILSLLYARVHCANYQRYGETTDRYPTYSTISNLYDQNPYKTASYANDISPMPKEGSRFPNYNPSGTYTTSSYNSYGITGRNYNGLSTYSPGLSNYNSGISNYNSGSSNYNSGLNNYNSGLNNYNSGLNNYNSGFNNYNTDQNNYNSGMSGYNTGRGLYPQSGITQRYGEGYSSYEMPFMRNIGEYCINRSPQNGIWVDSLMGMWYGVEVVQHLAGDSYVDRSYTCIVIHLAEPTDQPSSENPLFHVQHIKAKFRQEYRHLRLLWDEAGESTEYSLFFRNDSAGYWQVLDAQNGSMTTRPSYQQFSGTIQVLKAVNDHLVLSFCQEPVNNKPAQLYSVLFSREPGHMPRWEVESVHNMLQNKKLSTASRRMVCGNSGSRPITSIIFSIITCVVAYAIGVSS